MLNWSTVLIARNEEKTLPRLMASLSEFQAKGGEVVLVDTGSTDGTAKVATELGCRVVEVGDRFRVAIDDKTAEAINAKFVVDGEEPVVQAGDSLFDYASARNFAASLALNDMVAMPDCDEAYTRLDLDAIQAAVAESGADRFVYEYVFSHDEHGNEGVAFKHSKFYDRRKHEWRGVVHECLFPRIN